MNNDVIKVQLSCGVDYYKGEKGDKPVKGVDYFTQEDIAEIVEQIETEGVDLSEYAKKEYVDNAISGVVVNETDPTVPAWAKQANKPTYTAQEVGALPANTALFSGDYNDLSNKPTIPTIPTNISAFTNDAGYLTAHQSLSGYATEQYVDDAVADILTPIVIQATIAGQPSIVNGNYRLPLTITSNNLPEAYAQYQTHPSTVGIAIDLTAMGMPTKMYMDCESFYRGDDGNGGYAYLTFGEFNDSSITNFGFDFQNINVRLSTFSANDSYGTVIGVATVNDLATVATSGDYNDLTNKPTIPTAYTLPTATTSTLGGVKVDGNSIVINNGVISASGVFSSVVAEQRDANDNIVAGVGLEPQGIIMLNQYEGVDVNGTITVDSNGDLCWNNTAISNPYTLPTATTSTLGGVKVDGTTITITDGVISATSSGGSSYTFTNGLTENNGTVSWNLNDRIKAGSGQKSVYINGAYGVSGHYSFAEGEYTRADGSCAHAEGQYAYAVGLYQHAEGRANILDSNSIFQNIAGNGTNNNNRATMFARDWNGNEYLSGNLFVGCNDFTTTANGLTTANAGGSRVATMSDLTADNIPYYYIEGEDPETGDPIRSETADTLTVALDNVNEDIAGILSGEWINTSMISAGTDETTGDTIHLDSVLSDMETAISNAGGGSSYTAGQGINIDSNGVISAKPSYSGHYGINGVWSFWREKVNPNGGYSEDTDVSSAEQAVECLLEGFVIQQDSNLIIDIRDIITKRSSEDSYTVIVFNLNTKKITERKNISSRDNYQYTLSRFNQYVKLDNFTLLELTNITTSTVKPSGLLPYFIIHKSSNYTTYNVADNLDEVMETVNTRIPSAPTTDGDYVLKVSVSSGTPTYSWVAET